MRGTSSFPKLLLCPIVLTSILALTQAATTLAAQDASFVPIAAAVHHSLITQPIDENQLTVLKGNVHPLARPEFDLGTAPASLPMQRMLLVLKRSPQQESALRKLLDDQQDKRSPSYHKWLTPEQFGKQFGPADSDMQAITGWLQSHGFQLGPPTKGRTVLEFSGSASQVQEAFHTSIHKYIVNGEQHWANSTDPQIPTALTPAVAGVRALNNFPAKPMNVLAGVGERDPKTGKIHPSQPLLTFPSGCVENSSVSNYCSNWLGPYDFATIYDVLPLWNAGIDGAGVTVAIVGETDIQMSDVQAFRSFFGLPVNNPAFIWNGPDPGIQGDESEADIDVQWSGAVAKGATIDFVISESTETTSGTDLSAVYIVENNFAAVMSESYGECELGLGTTGNQFYNTLWQQASAQGITVLVSAGDAGSAGCDNFDASSPAPAQYGLQISGYASTPYNVAVGGTDFNDFNDPGTYWSTTDNPTTQESALKYIPESTWNDSCTNAIWETFSQFSTNPEMNCNNPQLNDVTVVAGSGGVSNCTTPSGSEPSDCAGGYARPAWQTGSGSFSTDGKRDIPDVSLFASNGFVGQAYVICQADNQGACPGSFLGFGGTSVSSPAFAGIMAMVNQQTGERQGNANYVLYKLAAQQPSAFHDVTVGTNAVPCATGSPNCTTTIAGDSYGILSGYNAGAGYDLTTGLGSVDANNLVTKWNSVTLLPSTTTLSSLTPTTITHGQTVNFTVSVAPESGTGTPTGSISLEGGPSSDTGGIAGFSLSNGAVSGSTEMLPGGTYSVTAHYPGDSTYEASESSPISVTVNKENSQPQVFLVTFNGNSIVNSNTTTAVYGSPYILRVNVENSASQSCAPVSSSGGTGCPTGSVTLTDNGAVLDAGTFTLNTYGYFEDQAVQLPGGTNSVVAVYGGDNSFSSGSATTPIAITPALTSFESLNGPLSVVAGSVAQLTAFISTSSSGAAPTGTVTFYANGTPISGQVTYSSSAGSAAHSASLTASLTASFSTPGTYNVSVMYAGDQNYLAATANYGPLTVMFQPPNLTLQPSPGTVSAGSSFHLAAVVAGYSTTIAPTGTISFAGYEGPVQGTVSYSTITDPSTGNLDLQGVITLTPAFSDSYSAQYSGDSNFSSAQTNGFVSSVTVTGNDFSLLSQSGTYGVEPGNSVTWQFLAGLQSAAVVSFGSNACSGLPSESTCSFSPNPVTRTGSFNVTVTTTAPTAAFRKRASMPPAIFWPTFLPVGALLIVGAARRRILKGAVTTLLLGILVAGLACGGSPGNGGDGGGGTTGGSNSTGTPAGPYTVTVTATSGTGSSAITHTATFNMVVE